MSEYREQAEKLANSMYKPHRFGDTPAWFSVSCDLAERVLELETALRELQNDYCNQVCERSPEHEELCVSSRTLLSKEL